MTKRAQSGLSRANYDLGGSRFEATSDEITEHAKKAGEAIYEERV